MDDDRERPPAPPGGRLHPDGSRAPTALGDGPRSAPSRFARAFEDGDEIAGRYRVVRFLAQGGMGEVYEVVDRELGERVALKTILPRIAANPVALERFRREILFARKVTHPNVCRIFDIGRHEFPSPDGESVTFLTMELLEGESLSKRLRRQGPMPTEQALPLVLQITAGLGAAHRAGVVHRDLKPANIFLVPSADGLRAVVTDFGLARFEAADEGIKEMTGTGELLGTPSYMSPEQLEGQTPTTASDIYALGLVLYELLTGARAFDGDTAFQIALKRLRQPPTAPSKHLPGIDPVWEKTILRCLEREPEDRFTTVEEIGEVLSGERPLSGGLSARQWRRGARAALRSPAVWVAAAVMVAAAAVVAVRGQRSEPGVGRGVAARRSVAVLGFENVAGDQEAAWMATALGEILTTELAAGGALRTIPGETVARVRADLGLGQIQSLGEDTLRQLQGNLGTDLVVLGSYTAAGDRLRVDVRVQDARSGELVIQESASGSREELFELAVGAAGAVRAGLGVTAGADETTALASLAASPTAARLYSEGLARLRGFDALGARGLLLEAAEAAPESPLVHSALAATWSDLGYRDEALEAAQRALELSEGLGREERTRIRGEYQMAARDWDGAVASFESLWTFFPDNLGYGLFLARAQLAAGQGDQALGTLAELRGLPAPDSEDPRIDLEEARGRGALGQFDRQLEAARGAIERSRSRGARLLLGEAYLEEASAQISLGSYAPAEAACQQALEIFSAAGYQHGLAVAHEKLAFAAYYQGDLAAAEARLRQSLEIARVLGDREAEANGLNVLGAIQLARGSPVEAERSFESVLGIASEVSSAELEALALNNLALVLQRRGDLAGAVDRFQQALALERSRGNQMGEARALQNIAGSYATGGDLARAREQYEQAVAVYRRLESPSELADVLHWLGEVLLWQGELAGARSRHQEALELRRRVGNLGAAAQSAAALAGVALQEAYLGRGSFEVAARELEGVVDACAEQGWAAEEATALAQLAEADLGRGRVAEARAALDRASALAGDTDTIATRLLMQVTAGRVLAAAGDLGEADRQLGAALEQAEQVSILGLEYDVRLALGEVELAAGRIEPGRQRLEELRREAEARGWFLVAARASALLKRTG